MKKILAALDQGTTSSRAVIFTEDGEIIAAFNKEFPQHYPKPGWVEHDPKDILNSQITALREAVRLSGVNAAEIAAIGITNQRETTFLWDRNTGECVGNAIVWQCRRTSQIVDRLVADGCGDMIREKTGLVPDAYFSGTKIGWILDNVPGARARAEAGELLFGTVDSWLIWNFSKRGAHLTDPSNASRTLLFNIHTGQWDDELLDLLNVPRAMLPEVAPSSSVMARAHPEFFGHAVPVAGVAGDQQAATFGNACLKEGMLKNTYGTGCFLLLNTGARPRTSRNNLLATVAWETQRGRSYALEGSVFAGGAVVQWLRDGLGFIQDSSELEGLAASVPDNGGVYLVPAFTGLGAPHWDQYARGVMVGLTRGVGRGHIARAAIESIALQTLDVMEAMRADAGLACSVLRVDGGASRNNMLMQCQADLTGVPVERPVVTETTALGAACLAGLAVGFWADEEEAGALWQLDRRFEPRMSEERRAELLYHWRRAVERSRRWIEPEE